MQWRFFPAKIIDGSFPDLELKTPEIHKDAMNAAIVKEKK